MSAILSAAVWEAMYAPYDPSTYQAVLDLLKPEDIVLDIGGGDLRCSRQMARIARKVYAVEINRAVLEQGLDADNPLPANLIAICADARSFAFPTDVTVGILLMRHCLHFGLYMRKLSQAGARRLITNARWHMSVEMIEVQIARTSFEQAAMGWYGCECGALGFRAGPAEQWTPEMDSVIQEVSHCPQCK